MGNQIFKEVMHAPELLSVSMQFCNVNATSAVTSSHSNFFPSLSTGGAILMFSVELLDLQKPSALNFLSVQREFWIYLGGFVLFVWLGYELYRRAVKQSEDLKKKKPNLSKKSQSKKKK